MKSMGMRPLDNLGRLVIPKELRNIMRLRDGEDSVEVFFDDRQIVIRKYEPGCIFCGNTEGMFELDVKKVCPDCAAKLWKMHRAAG